MDCGSIQFLKNGRYGRAEIFPSDRKIIDAMAADLHDFCASVAWDEELQVVVFAFDGRVSGPAEIVQAVADLKIPTIAAIAGDCCDFGLELALACDIRIGTDGARFGLPGIGSGIIPGAGGTQRLPRLIGRARALDMILTGVLLDSQEAMSIGLVNRLSAEADLLETSRILTEEMASKSPLALSYVKEALHKGQDLSLDEGLRMELDLYLLLFTTEDRIEGVTAFQEKRTPNFKGQ
jgi:enoyl-CoA hydratase/carnithine racemase